MPLILNQYENTHRLALWSLVEPLEFFEEKAQLNLSEQEYYDQMTSVSRKKEWLAVRVLLNEVLGFWPHITYTETGKPLLQNHSRHLSITHSKTMVGILLCTNPYAGIDIEKTDRSIEKVEKRFLSEKERELLKKNSSKLSRILFWCAKEAIYKAVNESNVLFSKQIFLDEVDVTGTIKSRFTSEKETLDFLLNFVEVNGHMVVWTA